jgi:hypothetical protein
MLRRASRDAERGQVLIMAIAFLALVAVITVAVLNLADAAALQHVHTEATAVRDSSAEGGAAYANVDAARGNLNCTPGSTGQLKMTNGNAVGYTINNCNPGNTLVLGGGGHCLLCILNKTPVPPATTTSPTTSVVSAAKGITTSGGDDYINGTIAGGTQLTATASPGPASIRQLIGANPSGCVGCVLSPLPVKTYSSPVSDPFSSLLAPSPVAGKPMVCNPSCIPCPAANWNATTGCAMPTFSNTTATIGPGLWASLSVSGGPTTKVTLSAGTFVFTGSLAVSGQGSLTATGVTIYLACPNYGPTGQSCLTSATKAGGTISFSGQGAVSISAPGSPQYTNVSGIADVAILADPNLLDPGGVGACTGGTGTCIYNVSGKGASVTGSIDTRSGGITIGGNGAQTENNGILIANSLFIGVSGGTAGLSLTGPGTITTGSCTVFDDSVSGTTTNGAVTTSSTGRAIIQATCGLSSANGTVDFNYRQ